MSTEITYQLQTSLTLGSVRDMFIGPSDVIAQATARFFRNVQEVGTSAEMLETGDVTVPGVCVFFNLDTTNYVEVGTMGSVTGLPANSKLRVAADGTPYLYNATSGLWYPIRVDGPDGNVYIEVGQNGSNVPLTTTFVPFLKLKPGERQLCRVTVDNTSIYARSDTANVPLFYIVYDD